MNTTSILTIVSLLFITTAGSSPAKTPLRGFSYIKTGEPSRVSFIKLNTQKEEGRLIIEFTLTEDDKPGILIANSAGETMYEAANLFFSNSFEHHINVTGWEHGDYYVTIYTSASDITQKVTLNH